MSRYVVIFLFFVLAGGVYGVEEAVLIPFFSYDDKGKLVYVLNEYSYGVSSSVYTFLRFLPGFSFKVFDRKPLVVSLDIKKVMGAYGKKDKYILGVYGVKGDLVEYEVFVYGGDGNLVKRYKFRGSVEDLFESVDRITDFVVKVLIPGFRGLGIVNFVDFRLGDKEFVLYINGVEYANVRSGYEKKLRLIGEAEYLFEIRDKGGVVYGSNVVYLRADGVESVSFYLKGEVVIGEVMYKERGKEGGYGVYLNGVRYNEKARVELEAEKRYLVEVKKGDEVVSREEVYLGSGMDVELELYDRSWGNNVRVILGSGIGIGMGYVGVEYFFGRYTYLGFMLGGSYFDMEGAGGKRYEFLFVVPRLELGYVWMNDLGYLVNSRVFLGMDVVNFYNSEVIGYRLYMLGVGGGVMLGLWVFDVRVGGRFEVYDIFEESSFGFGGFVSVGIRL